ncbi:putative bifunctional diguanylate cyclase/phosphodiesterase [Gordoniibacillus kamchatkensis]|uniref:putative bifunctional diguanylate cyclase/phosphodiesterase n=1 Tax=Gordoniibacillus kamchatkensis TaxID=1590651 RepID=UPI000695E919|nr:EAL domain-containing protein [Paenibacillus sp. VKM B-2647]
MDTSSLRQLFRKLPRFLDEIDDSIYIMKVENGEFTYSYVNRPATRFSGITTEDVGSTFFAKNSEQMAHYLHRKYSRAVAERTAIRFEAGVVMPNGMVSGESIVTPIFGEDGEVEYVVCVTRDITAFKKTEELLRHYAYHDDLTGLGNRRYLLEHATGLSCIMLLDLDHFKKLNDTFGHDAGDALLVEVADRLRASFGDDYTLVRLGGDEFVLAAHGNAADPERVAEEILSVFCAPFPLKDRQIAVGVSVGVAIREDGEDVQTLLKHADIALYQAKGEGRRRYHIYESAARYDHVVKFAYELALSHAVENRELELLYQPIYNPFKRRIVGCEALMRWNRTPAEVVSPQEFIPVAEETGLIIPIGDWAVRQACRDWRELSKRYGPGFKVAVNISRIQLHDESFVDRILRMLQAEGVDPSALELEITESVVLHNVHMVQSILHRLRQAGFTISLDDFGAGYSSLSMLTLLPIDTVKIDRSFIRDMNAALVSAMLAMAKALNLQVVAEGVEEARHFVKLVEMDCPGLQGYYICKPVARDDLPERAPLRNDEKDA